MVAQQNYNYSYVSLLAPKKICLVVLGDLIDSQKLAALGREVSFEIIVPSDRVIEQVTLADVVILFAQCETAVEIARQIKDTPIIWVANKKSEGDLAMAIASGIKGILNNLENIGTAVNSVRHGAHFFARGVIKTKSKISLLTSSEVQIKRWSVKLAYHTIQTWIERRSIRIPAEQVVQDLGLSQPNLVKELEAIDESRSQLNNLEKTLSSLQLQVDSSMSACEISERARKILQNWLLQDGQDGKPFHSYKSKTIKTLPNYSCKTQIELRFISILKKIDIKLTNYVRLWQRNGSESQRQDLFELAEYSKTLAERYKSNRESVSQKQRKAYEEYSDLLENLRAASKINVELQQALWEKLHNVFILKVKELSYQYAHKTVESFREQLKLYLTQFQKTDLFLKTIRNSLLTKLGSEEVLSPLTFAYLQEKFSIQEVEKNLEKFFERHNAEAVNENNCAEILENLLLKYFQQQMQQIDYSCRQELV
jgi:hypothetical protein